MSDTFKSGQWRICAQCLGSIKPKDRVTYLYDEVACMECLTADEEKALTEHTRLSQEFGDDIDTIISSDHVTVVPAEMFDELMKDEEH